MYYVSILTVDTKYILLDIFLTTDIHKCLKGSISMI